MEAVDMGWGLSPLRVLGFVGHPARSPSYFEAIGTQYIKIIGNFNCIKVLIKISTKHFKIQIITNK
jgi:hypothetical protein